MHNVLVTGGFHDENGQFQAQRSEVVPSDRLSAFFRREWQYGIDKSPVVKIANTQSKTTLYWCS